MCLAQKFEVIGVDIDRPRVLLLTSGRVPIQENGLEALLKKGLKEKHIAFSDDFGSLLGARLIFVTVGTPPRRDGSIDLSQVTNACEMIGRQLSLTTGRPLIVIKSTVTPGTTATIAKPLLERESGKKCGVDFGLASNPEFLREGSAVQDTLHPDRIILGPVDEASGRALRTFYKRFYGPNLCPIVETSPENAELIKYASNTFLATRISFVNFIARICETLPGADVNEVVRGMSLDPRIGRKYLQAGPGFGGACFPKDLRALDAFALQRGLDASILGSVQQINDTQPDWIFHEVERAVGGVERKEVAILGVAFKEESDDVRESRAIVLAKKLISKGASVRIADPKAIEGAKRELGKAAKYYDAARDCIAGADAAVVMTAWSEFKRLKPKDFATLMRTPVLFDARRLYDANEYRLEGLKFRALGRGNPA